MAEPIEIRYKIPPRERLLLAAVEQAAFLFGALGHDGTHDTCDPCEFVRRYAALSEAEREFVRRPKAKPPQAAFDEDRP